MRSLLIEVACVFLDHPLYMFTILDQNMIEAFSSKTAHKPFTSPIRLGCSIRYTVSSLLYIPGPKATAEKQRSIFFITVTNQILRPSPPGRCFSQLLRRPFIICVLGNTAMYNPSRFQFRHYKYIPLPEQPVINCQIVACPDVTGLILQERSSGFPQGHRDDVTRNVQLPVFRHVFLNGPFTDFHSQF